MMSLVDYEASDSEGESENSESQEHTHAQVFTYPKKGVNVIANEKRNEDDYFGSTRLPPDNADASDTSTAPISGESTSVLASLPSVVEVGTKRASEQLNDAQLEDIVKRKKWEMKLAEKAARKRRKKEKKAKRGKVDKSRKSDCEDIDGKPSKKARIEAFGGLTGLDQDSDEEIGSDQLKPKGSVAPSSVSNGLLSLLPQPKSETRSESKSASILLPNAVRANKQQAKKDTKQQILKSKEVIDDEESDDSDVDSSDFFGLKSTSTVPTLRDVGLDHIGRLSTVMSDVSYGPSKPTTVLHQNILAVEADAATEGSAIPHEVPSTSGMIDDSIAQQMIYSHDVVGWGGARQVAARAVEAMVDVSVDQALGPNVQANLLKNLHNRSLAEAAISHLSAIPKAKGPDNTVARRKHQITYLASVAVSREEQLAEQWSQNRHTKRMSSQKYGF